VRRLLLIPVLLSVLLVAAPAAASDEPAEAPAETPAEEAGGPVPAIVVQTGSETEDVAAWTFRYLVPTLLVLGIATVAGLILYYIFGIKGRYRVVE
jgi:hypothetical protein